MCYGAQKIKLEKSTDRQKIAIESDCQIEKDLCTLHCTTKLIQDGQGTATSNTYCSLNFSSDISQWERDGVSS